jgi:hypothetical protein
MRDAAMASDADSATVANISDFKARMLPPVSVASL